MKRIAGLVIVLAAGLAVAATPATRPATRPAPLSFPGPGGQNQFPEVRFDGVALGDVVNFLHDVSGATITVDWDALKSAGVGKTSPITIRMRNVEPGEALQRVLDMAADGRLTFEVVNESVHVTTRQEEPTP